MTTARFLTAFPRALGTLGRSIFYLGDVIAQTFRRPFRGALLLQQMEFVGFQSIKIILLTGGFTGAVFGLQIGSVFRIFKSEGIMGGATGLALATELAPLVAGFLLTGRVGAAMAAEIATMVVNEQVDALEAMGIDPLNYLVAPRLLASLVMMPLLCGIFMVAGIFGTYLVGSVLYQVDPGVFQAKILQLVKLSDVSLGLRKMLAFSFFIVCICCHEGLHATKGSAGVGLATTRGVVKSLLALLITDFVISYFQIKWMS